MDLSWLVGQWRDLGEVAAKAVLIYATALVGLRVAERRTLAEWTIVDFAAAVAIGAVVGRTAIARDQSYVTGAVALLALILAHRLASLLRLRPLAQRFLDHPVRVLVAHGEVRRHELARCGLTEQDLCARLRERGELELDAIRLVLYEAKGGLTIVPETGGAVPTLVRTGLQQAAGFSEQEAAPSSRRDPTPPPLSPPLRRSDRRRGRRWP